MRRLGTVVSPPGLLGSLMRVVLHSDVHRFVHRGEGRWKRESGFVCGLDSLFVSLFFSFLFLFVDGSGWWIARYESKISSPR